MLDGVKTHTIFSSANTPILNLFDPIHTVSMQEADTKQYLNGITPPVLNELVSRFTPLYTEKNIPTPSKLPRKLKKKYKNSSNLSTIHTSYSASLKKLLSQVGLDLGKRVNVVKGIGNNVLVRQIQTEKQITNKKERAYRKEIYRNMKHL